ncbi:MAG: ferritin-like domain-containing protein [Myxococcales bacterium]|nr:ferritin-like domain-containing protein [Myxococcales bacterium]
MSAPPPPVGTLERWAWDYILAETLEGKLEPPSRPDEAAAESWEPDPPCRRLPRPGRPPGLLPLERPPKTPRASALADPRKRAQLMHTFFHHELQAAELMCWALLAFPEAGLEFRRGLLRICDDEIRHMHRYRDHLLRLDHPIGAFGVRDWFWERLPAARKPSHFVSLLGIGFEGGNLDHARRFAERFRAVGDEAGARLQEQIALEEISHVRFAIRWFERWIGPLDFERWRAELPPPLSPIVMRGRPMNREARLQAGMDERFLDALEAYAP